MTKQQEIQQKIDQVYALVRECEQIARETDGMFSLNLGRKFFGSASAFAEFNGFIDFPNKAKAAYEEETDNGWWTPSRNC